MPYDEEGVLSPVDLSADAILEIEEMNEGRREDAPAVTALFDFLRTPPRSVSFNGTNAVSMLSDVRSYPLLRNSYVRAQSHSAPPNFSEFKKVLEEYLKQLEEGIRSKDNKRINQAKALCIALHENWISSQMEDMYQRRERSDSRYLINDSVR